MTTVGPVNTDFLGLLIRRHEKTRNYRVLDDDTNLVGHVLVEQDLYLTTTTITLIKPVEDHRQGRTGVLLGLVEVVPVEQREQSHFRVRVVLTLIISRPTGVVI